VPSFFHSLFLACLALLIPVSLWFNLSLDVDQFFHFTFSFFSALLFLCGRMWVLLVHFACNSLIWQLCRWFPYVEGRAKVKEELWGKTKWVATERKQEWAGTSRRSANTGGTFFWGAGPRANREQTGTIPVADLFSHFCLFWCHGFCVIFFLSVFSFFLA